MSERHLSDAEHRQGPSEFVSADAMGATAVAYLVTGPMVFGGLGLLADHLLGIRGLVVLGILGGMALSVYTIWLRYGMTGTDPQGSDESRADTTHEETL
ncbi:hypothetical protein KC207_10535 [Phycicoccus sp. BSK3Z-2]|uniref:AtpZ/AtpI family protein n=1 Tax=Phycicoccus avicenniae TaxID=2828860 RepID=A0A941D910_9MICO|nr:hypothetical protein [Phycicoccus avicenniae]MBR7743726.1 hypothetical protein [Phycicoccus avicenniae]